MRQLRYATTVFVAVVILLIGSATAWAAETMTLTFIRHAESQANHDGIIDTSVPGPHITDPTGQQQAQLIAEALAPNDHDGIYASNMIRTQETAQPLATLLSLPIVVLPGLREISAGIFEGSSEDDGLGRLGYALAPALWTLGLRSVPVLGATDGNDFDARVDEAIRVIYDSGDRNPAVFSHGATIMFWTMMNVDNPDLGLLLSHQLDNTGVVVIKGSPEDGWTLVSWDGIEVPAEPSLFTKLFVDVRDLVTAPQTALFRVQQAFASGDIGALADAVRDGIVDVATKVVGFVPNVVGDIVGSASQSSTVQSDEPPTDDADVNAAAALRTTATQDAPVDTDDADDADDAKESLDTEKKRASLSVVRGGNKFSPGDTQPTTTTDDDNEEPQETVKEEEPDNQTGSDTVTAPDPTGTPSVEGSETAQGSTETPSAA